MRKKITFIGAGSTIFIKNIIGDIFQFESLYFLFLEQVLDVQRLDREYLILIAQCAT